jgi:hypothetical protein
MRVLAILEKAAVQKTQQYKSLTAKNLVALIPVAGSQLQHALARRFAFYWGRILELNQGKIFRITEKASLGDDTTRRYNLWGQVHEWGGHPTIALPPVSDQASTASSAFRIDDRQLTPVIDDQDNEMSGPGAIGQCCRIAFISYGITFSPCLCLRSSRWGW